MSATAAAIGAGVTAAGGIISAAQAYNANKTSQRQVMGFNRAEAEKTRAWQTEMSNTAYQRAKIDMRKAGLNPILMYAGTGGEAGTPTGATASASPQSFDFSDIARGLGSATNSALQGLQMKMALDMNKAQIENVKADTAKKQTEVGDILQRIQESISNVGINQYRLDRELPASTELMLQTALEKKQNNAEKANMMLNLSKRIENEAQALDLQYRSADYQNIIDNINKGVNVAQNVTDLIQKWFAVGNTKDEKKSSGWSKMLFNLILQGLLKL